jgi:hypothetical protein
LYTDLVDQQEVTRTNYIFMSDVSLTANGGFVRVPRRPTNHPKRGVRRTHKPLTGSGTAGSGTGRSKFKHDGVKMYYQELEGAYDAAVDALLELDD